MIGLASGIFIGFIKKFFKLVLVNLGNLSILLNIQLCINSGVVASERCVFAQTIFVLKQEFVKNLSRLL